MTTLSTERLQAIREQNEQSYLVALTGGVNHALINELLDAVEAQQAEIERLRGSLEAIRRDLGWTVALLDIGDGEARESLPDCLRDTYESCVAALREESGDA